LKNYEGHNNLSHKQGRSPSALESKQGVANKLFLLGRMTSKGYEVAEPFQKLVSHG